MGRLHLTIYLQTIFSIVLIYSPVSSIGENKNNSYGGRSINQAEDGLLHFGSYRISPKPCTIDNRGGTCMFVWECRKTEGKHLGLCVDGFMFGSCCSHNSSINSINTINSINSISSNNNNGWTKPPHNNNYFNTKPPLMQHPSATFSTIRPDTESTTSIGDPDANLTNVVEDSDEEKLPFVTKNNAEGKVTSTTKRPYDVTIYTTKRPYDVMTSTTKRPYDVITSTTKRPYDVITSTTKRPYDDIFSTTKSPYDDIFSTTKRPYDVMKTTKRPYDVMTTTKITTTAPSTTTEKIVTTSESIVSTSVNYEEFSTHGTNGDNEEEIECGVAPLYPQMRIVGGKQSALGMYPWIVSVRRTSFFGFSSTHRCGGALLNSEWVATAGHCVDDLLTTQIRVRLGEWDFSGTDEKYPHIESTITKKVVHPSYNFFTYENDLALLKLEKPIKFSKYVRPICLPGNQDLLIGENATVAGWGRLSENGELPSRLQHVTVPIMSNEKCRELFLRSNRVEHIPPIFLCAGYEKGGQDSCQGDSGGPLQVRGKDKRYFLAGVISWGIGCAEPNMPGVCTRISKFTEWILNHVT